MNWQWELDRAIQPIKRSIARTLGPDPSRLGHPLFSERIKDRMQRWVTERQPNPYAAVSSKVNGQAYMRSLGYSVPEVYGIYPSLEEIPRFDDLPDTFVMKPTSGSSGAGVFLMRNGFDLIRKRHFTRDELIQTARAFQGPGMKGINRAWIAEELLFNFDNSDALALDYKFFCFGPKVAYIQVNLRTGLTNPVYWCWFRDADWRPIGFRVNWDKFTPNLPLAKPPFLDEMLGIASDVAGRLNIFVRVDMFASHRGPVFGEFTAYPHAGGSYTPRGDAWLGSLWTTQDGGI